MNSRQRIALFDINFDDIQMEELVTLIKDSEGFTWVATTNVQHLTLLPSNKESDLAQCYRSASITTCDSRIIQMLSSLYKKPIKNIITGSDLTKYYFEEVFDGSECIMVVGSCDEDIKELSFKYGCTNLHYYSPPMGFINKTDEVQRTLDEVLLIRPKYLFLAVGFPRQELLACKLKAVIDFDCTAFCIGASIDFLTGKQKRAPKVWGELRFEWLYRFIKEPRRLFRRYFIDSWRLFPILIKEFKKND